MFLHFIRGIVINDSTLRVLIGKRFPEMWVQITRLDCVDLSDISKKLELGIYTGGDGFKKFVIGIEYGVYASPDVIYVPPFPDHFDEEIRRKLMKFSDCLDPSDIRSVVITKN